MSQWPAPIPPTAVDPNYLVSQVFPLIGVIAVAIVGGLVLKWLFRSPVGEAWAERIRNHRHRRKYWRGMGAGWSDASAEGPANDGRVATLEEQVSYLQGQVSELAERLDFAERLLADRRERKHLEGHHGNL